VKIDEQVSSSTTDGIWRSVWSRPITPFDDRSYGRLLNRLRGFLASFAGARPDATQMERLEAVLTTWEGELEARKVDEDRQVYAQRPNIAGRGQVTCPAVIYTDVGDDTLRARVRFDRFFLGSNGAAHGGAVAFVLDEVAGRLCHLGGRSTARTAYLNMNYRSITPIDTDLDILGVIEREDGRKRFLRVEIRKEETLCAIAEVLMVALKVGQA
jgi:acyl-coenzyme A thioesterase PaaI-like protein